MDKCTNYIQIYIIIYIYIYTLNTHGHEMTTQKSPVVSFGSLIRASRSSSAHQSIASILSRELPSYGRPQLVECLALATTKTLNNFSQQEKQSRKMQINIEKQIFQRQNAAQSQ